EAELGVTSTAVNRSFIKKIDKDGVMTEIAGSEAMSTSIVAGRTLLGNPAGSPTGGANTFRAVNGVMYIGGTTLWTGTEGGTWVSQANGTQGFAVDRSNNNIYYIRSNILYRKPYVANGTGVAVSLINFTNVLPEAQILDHDPSLSGVIYILSGNLIYRYDTN